MSYIKLMIFEQLNESIITSEIDQEVVFALSLKVKPQSPHGV